MIDEMIEQLEADYSIHKMTRFMSQQRTSKVTRQGRPDKRNRQSTYVVTIGKPNYAEREFIKLLKRADEPFPVKKMQLKLYPVRH